MLIRRPSDIMPSDITPRPVFERRRELMAAAGLAAAGALLPGRAHAASLPALASVPGPFSTMEKLTPREHVTTYNNFYEFGTDKSDPARLAPGLLRTRPWTVTVEGEVRRPRVFGIDDLLKLAPMEERIYRLRCVERWSMVVPWIGYPLSALLKQVEPTGNAKYVQFITLDNPKEMPGLASRVLDWPYQDGLRLDEAMNPLTLMVFGLYGDLLPAQNGAPLRMAIPWKYGYKGPKSIVRIRLLEKRPVGSWEQSQPNEYGFYSNVNPERDHPRWSQKVERRLGEDGILNRPRKTLPFNGYAEQVASLYAGMDLIRNH